MSFQTILLPLSADDPRNKTFRYEGYDIITLQKEVERDYTIPEPQTAQEVIGYYSRRIAESSQTAVPVCRPCAEGAGVLRAESVWADGDLSDPRL